MINGDKVTIVDSDESRREKVTGFLRRLGAAVQPYCDEAELRRTWPSKGCLLIHDSSPGVERILDGIARHGEWMPAIVYATEARPERVVDVVLRGAVDYLAWPFHPGRLRKRLRALIAGKRSLAVLHRRAIRAHNLIGELTDRQRDVLYALANGSSNKLIARTLDISPRTVEIHRANMMSKLGARTAHEAVTVAFFAALRSGRERDDRFEPQLLSE